MFQVPVFDKSMCKVGTGARGMGSIEPLTRLFNTSAAAAAGGGAAAAGAAGETSSDLSNRWWPVNSEVKFRTKLQHAETIQINPVSRHER